ncbi:LacI family DNA-binding transcriptional regulator [Angustibacter peucedani]
MAALAGVSRATAGRVLSGSPRVSEHASKAVLDAARELSYVTNRAARSLVTRRSDSVAFVVAEDEARVFADPFFPAVLRGAHQVLADAELQLVFVVLSTPAEHEQFFRFAAGGHVDGAIFVSLHGDDPLPRRLREVGVPSVLTGRPYRADDDTPHVDADNVGGARLATQALLAAGCRRVATIAGPLDMPASQDRLAGFEAELEQAGVRTARARVTHGDFTTESGYQAMRRLLRATSAPDGVFVANDSMAVGALRALREAGLDVPGQVKVVGFDDSPVAAASHPALTTVRQPTEQLGRELALLVTGLAARTTTPRSLVLPTELVTRATC